MADETQETTTAPEQTQTQSSQEGTSDAASKIYPDQGKQPEKTEDKQEASEGKREDQTTEKTCEPTDKDKEAVPGKYELKLPDGSKLDASWLEKISAEAKAKGFSQEQAQQLIDERSSVVGEYHNGLVSHFQQERQTWKSAVEADPEIGGAKLKETVAHAQRAFNAFGTDKLRSILNETGYGDHPELVRWAAKVGRALAEDKSVTGEPKTPTKKSAAEILYGGTQPKRETTNP